MNSIDRTDAEMKAIQDQAPASVRPEDLRERIDACMRGQQWSLALSGLRDLFRKRPTSASAQFVVKQLAGLPFPVERIPYRIAFLRSFTLEPVVPLLQAGAGLQGIDLQVWMGGFNTYAQELLNENSGLYQFQPDVIVLALQTRDVVPGLWEGYCDRSKEEVQEIVDRAIDDYRRWIERLTTCSRARLIVQGLELPAAPANGILDDCGEFGQSEAIRVINAAVRRIASETAGGIWFDYDQVVALAGRQGWHDETKWLTARMPVSAECLPLLAQAYLRFLHPMTGRVAKVLAVDLDNTLWGGVAGEEGPAGVRLGREYPGAAYTALQRALLDLKRRGILLAVCSKNNRRDALEVLDGHAEMLLRSTDFAFLWTEWGDKAEGLRKIAEALNVGTDAIAFLDDNPVERERVKQAMPEVHVIDLPPSPMEYARAVRDCPLFERLARTHEDGQRGHYYSQQQKREELRQGAATVEEFLHSLNTEVEIARADEASLPRIAQLLQKTNQFNLTTRRHTEKDLRVWMSDPAWTILSIRVSDRFGDSGLTGAAVTHQRGEIVEIDSFLLSCRVIGRGIETALLAPVAEAAILRGARILQGWYVVTRKNAPAADFYRSHGFAPVAARDGDVLWEMNLAGASIQWPAWIQRRDAAMRRTS